MHKSLKIKYFKTSEFDSPDLPGSGKDMDAKIPEFCDAVREEHGRPVHINSGARTKKHNAKINGKKRSAHLKKKGKYWAADIRCRTSRLRSIIIRKAPEFGITRIGIAKNFVHVDTDKTLPQNVYWIYK